MLKALLVVDMQKDFCPGGPLSVPEGDKIVPTLNKYMEIFLERENPVFLTRDWHPQTTRHFKESGGLWPRHCVENTDGAKFHPELSIPNGAILLSKGMDPEKDGYSAVETVDKDGKGFLEILNDMDIDELFIGGLATDYCVKQTALDLLKEGIEVKILVDAIKGVNIGSNDSKDAIKQMLSKGAEEVSLETISERL